jgi:hypothetical protein
MVLDTLERVVEELERIANPRELTVLFLAVVMVAFGAAAGTSDSVAIAMIAIGSGMFFIGIFLPVLTEFEVSATGFKGKLRERDEEVRTSLEPHADGLLDVAAALTGDQHAAKQLFEKAVLETYLAWQDAKREGPAEAVSRRLEDLAPSFSTVSSPPEPESPR